MLSKNVTGSIGGKQSLDIDQWRAFLLSKSVTGGADKVRNRYLRLAVSPGGTFFPGGRHG